MADVLASLDLALRLFAGQPVPVGGWPRSTAKDDSGTDENLIFGLLLGVRDWLARCP